MNAIVRVALARPYTFVVMAMLIAIGGLFAMVRMPVDIFPNIPVPVIGVAWTYANLSPEDMSGRVELPFQRALTTTVNDIEHIEGESLNGIGVTKIFFQPGADIRVANAQVTAIAQTILRQLPPGIVPPFILNYNASTVPIVQLALSGNGLGEQQLYDYGLNAVRTRIITVPGAAVPYPYGGRVRQIQMDIDPDALRARNLSASDVATALANQTQITPAGFVKIGDHQYNFRLNNAPPSVDGLDLLPIRAVDGTVTLMRDVAHVRDGSAPQQNVVHVDGQRSTLITVLKAGTASTIAIVDGIRAMLPEIVKGLPKTFTITPINDQSAFVKAAVHGVISEGVIAAALTSLMILLFLGSWRATVIVVVSIPLSVLGAIAALWAFGQTLNLMTLGGLALAVGMLVDEATVTIENIEWHLEQHKDVRTAILDGVRQIGMPALLSLLCICVVFLPVFRLDGLPGYLFVPMALSVGFAMTVSFLLSRTLVPTMAMYLLRAPHARSATTRPASPLQAVSRRFERRFARLRGGYARVLQILLGRRRAFAAGFLLVAFASLALVPFLGRNFFPQVDSGAIALHVRGPIGMRIEETSALFQRIERRIRDTIPASDIASITDNIGLPNSAVNTVYDASGTIGSQDGTVAVALRPGHAATARYVDALRADLPRAFPAASFAFLPPDITSQILNFGAPAPIDIQIASPRVDQARSHASRILRAIRGIDGLVDARIQQPAGAPELRFDADRMRIAGLGFDENDLTRSVATSLAGTSQTAPIYWLNPKNKVTYPVVVQAPEYRLASVDDLVNLPVTSSVARTAPQPLGALGTIRHGVTSAVETQYNLRPVIDVFAGADGRDLGAVAADVRAVLRKLDATRPETVTVTMRGQYQTMNTTFGSMGYGLLVAIALIYLLIVVALQSWTDPLIVISALPAALAGIGWMLFATGTPLSVPALAGAIMCMGIATANSILVVSFARERRALHGDAARAALEAGVTRLRPVLMTALAMIIGMVPMALGVGAGGAQNAPLGRAVIGGLAFATCATLLLVPILFSIVHGGAAVHRPTPHGAHDDV